MENHASVTGWQKLFFSCIQMLQTFGGRGNRYFWDIRLKILRIAIFNLLFQLVLRKVFKSELCSCLPKVDHVIKSCKELEWIERRFEPVMRKEIFHDRFENLRGLYSLRSMVVLSGALLSGEAAKTLRGFSAMLRKLGFVRKTMHAWLGCKSVVLIEMLPTFGGRVIAIAPFEIKLKILRLPNLNMLFQLAFFVFRGSWSRDSLNIFVCIFIKMTERIKEVSYGPATLSVNE